MTKPLASARYGDSPATEGKGVIDERMIGEVVDAFYDRARSDAILGPVFNSQIADWAPHLARMRAFWSSVTLGSGRYHGRPMERHLPLAIDAGHFDRWLELFAATADEVCPPQAAAIFKDCARRIADSLELGRAAHCGVRLRRGERFHMQTTTGTEASHAN